MASKKYILFLSIFLIFISIVSAYAADSQYSLSESDYFFDNADDRGCCSVIYQLEGNDSMIAFRRDSDYSADIHIEKVNWSGHDAIRQYKTVNGYFCQVIVTYNGWTLGFGGLDDGEDNEIVENITMRMVTTGNVTDSDLEKIQQIKQKYGRGHVVIKAPNGNYWAVFTTSIVKGKLEPGDYISVPNKESFFRTGTVPTNTTNKVGLLCDLARSDMYGLTRRDITVYHFHQVNNDTFKGNITDIFLSNDDGSYYDMSTGGLADDVSFNNTVYKASEIPIAPDYLSLGSITFEEEGSTFGFFDLAMIVITVILLGILGYVGLQYIKYYNYQRRRRR